MTPHHVPAAMLLSCNGDSTSEPVEALGAAVQLNLDYSMGILPSSILLSAILLEWEYYLFISVELGMVSEPLLDFPFSDSSYTTGFGSCVEVLPTA